MRWQILAVRLNECVWRKTLLLPNFPHEWYNIQKELLRQFWFSIDHETFQQSSSLFDQLENRILGETDRMTDIDRPDPVQFALCNHLLQDLFQQKGINLSESCAEFIYCMGSYNAYVYILHGLV